MANVALQNGKVILKGGNVSCTCCSSVCCMYPAQALIDGIYTVENLPDELLAFSPSDGTFVTVEKTGGIDPAYIYPANPTITIFIAEYEGIFQWHGPGGLPYGNCLIAESFVLDKFADTYTVQSTNGLIPNTLVTRISRCVWIKYFDNPDEYPYCPSSQYETTPEGDVNLIYEGPPYGFVALQIYNEKFSVLLDTTPCSGFLEFGSKIPNSSSPIGDYYDELAGQVTFIVS